MKLNKQYLLSIPLAACVWANKLGAEDKLSDWQSTLQSMDTTGKKDALENYYKYIIKTRDPSAIYWLANYSLNDSLGKSLTRIGFDEDIALTWLLIYSKDTSISSPDTVFWCIKHSIKEGGLNIDSLADGYYKLYKEGYMNQENYMRTVEASFFKGAFGPKTTVESLLKLNTDKGVYRALRILGIAVYNGMGSWLDFAGLFVEHSSVGRIAKQLKNLEKDEESSLLDKSCNQAALYAALIMAAKNGEKDKTAKDVANHVDSLDFAIRILDDMYTVDSSFSLLTSSLKITYDKASQDAFMKYYNTKAKKTLESAIKKYPEAHDAATYNKIQQCATYFSYGYGPADNEATKILDDLKESDQKEISNIADEAIKNKKALVHYE